MLELKIILMGIQDIERIHPIYRTCVDFSRLAEIPFTFKVDSGNYETAIQFKDKYHAHPPWSEDWKTNPEIFCPDILDYDHKIIIEFEEETGPRRTGAYLAKKGHGQEGDMDMKKDTRRNELYKMAGFRILRIWESHYNHSIIWKLKLFQFLIDCSKETIQK